MDISNCCLITVLIGLSFSGFLKVFIKVFIVITPATVIDGILSTKVLVPLWLVEILSWIFHNVLIGGNYQLIVSWCSDLWKLSADCLTIFWLVEIINLLSHDALIGGNYQLSVSQCSDWWKLTADCLTMLWLVETMSWLSHDALIGGNYHLIVSRCSDWWKLSADCLMMFWLVETISRVVFFTCWPGPPSPSRISSSHTCSAWIQHAKY